MSPRCLPILVCAVLLAACGGPSVRELHQHVYEGRYGPAEEAARSIYSGKKNDLIRPMQIGLIRRLGGDPQGSTVAFGEAAAMVDYFRSPEWGSEAGKWLANDTVANYDGDAFEHIQVDWYRVLNMVEIAQHQRGYWTPPWLGPVRDQGLGPVKHIERAISYSRRMTLNQLKETEDAAGRKRYIDDPFARTLAAALTWAIERPLHSDYQFSNVMLQKAAEAYAAEAGNLAGAKHFRYEAHPANRVFATLLHRNGMYYDPEYFREHADRFPPPRPIAFDPGAVGELPHPAALPEGHGMVMVLREPLQIGIVTGRGSVPGGAHRFKLGGVGFWAKGPGAGIVNAWGAFPIPHKLAKILAPGGFSVVKFEIPVHAADAPVPPPATASLVAHSGGRRADVPLEVCSDLDAYARATLKDQQPKVLMRTLFRTLVKQGAVAGAAEAIRRRNPKDGGHRLLAGAVNLVGSIAMSATENADCRSVTLLPDRVEAALVDCPAGGYNLTLQTPAGPVDCGPVTVPAGRLVVVPVRTF